MKVFGYLLVFFGFTDFMLANFMETDVWYDWFGLTVPDVIYPYTALIVFAIGAALVGVSKGNEKGDNASEPEVDD